MLANGSWLNELKIHSRDSLVIHHFIRFRVMGRVLEPIPCRKWAKAGQTPEGGPYVRFGGSISGSRVRQQCFEGVLASPPCYKNTSQVLFALGCEPTTFHFLSPSD